MTFVYNRILTSCQIVMRSDELFYCYFQWWDAHEKRRKAHTRTQIAAIKTFAQTLNYTIKHTNETFFRTPIQPGLLNPIKHASIIPNHVHQSFTGNQIKATCRDREKKTIDSRWRRRICRAHIHTSHAEYAGTQAHTEVDNTRGSRQKDEGKIWHKIQSIEHLEWVSTRSPIAIYEHEYPAVEIVHTRNCSCVCVCVIADGPACHLYSSRPSCRLYKQKERSKTNDETDKNNDEQKWQMPQRQQRNISIFITYFYCQSCVY